MQRALVDLDLRGQSGGVEGFAQHVLRLGILHVVVVGDGEQVVRVHLRDKQVGAVRLVGHESAAMEGRTGADAVRARPRGAHRDRAAHAVSGRAHLAVRIDGILGVEEIDKGPRVGDVGVGVERARERNDRVSGVLVLEARALGYDR